MGLKGRASDGGRGMGTVGLPWSVVVGVGGGLRAPARIRTIYIFVGISTLSTASSFTLVLAVGFCSSM